MVAPGLQAMEGDRYDSLMQQRACLAGSSFLACFFSRYGGVIHIYMRQEHIGTAAGLLLAFAKLSKAEVKYFMTCMNQYLFASPLARREMIKAWEAELDSLSHKRTGS